MKALSIIATVCLLALNVFGDDVLLESARDTLKRSAVYMRSLATHGGYLWEYSLDGKLRFGEKEATNTQIWVQPPGTPSMGMAFLLAYKTTGDAYYLSAARDAATALVAGQLESGGWDYRIEFDADSDERYYYRVDTGKYTEAELDKLRNRSTYDDNTTQSALMFLMRFIEVSNDTSKHTEIRSAIDYGLEKLMEAQYPNGGWPQRYDGSARDLDNFPIIKASIPEKYQREYEKSDYKVRYTLNDNTQRDAIRTMVMAWKQFGDMRYCNAALRGGDFLLLAQLPEPQPVWANGAQLGTRIRTAGSLWL